DGDFKEFLNPESLVVVKDARLEPAARDTAAGTHLQFERLGYFFADPVDSSPGALVFNRVVTLRDTWAKTAGARAGGGAREEAPPGPARARAARQEQAAAPRAETASGEHPRPRPRPRPGPAAAADSADAARARRLAEQHGLGEEEADLLAR